MSQAPPLPDPPDWSTLFDLLPVGAYRSTVDGRQLRANPALVQLNGYASEAELIAAVHDIAAEWYVDPARRTQFRDALETAGGVRGFVSEVYRHRTRERIWISENAHVLRDAQGRILFYEGTVEEITDRVRTQQALEHSEAQLRLISQRLPGVVYLAHVTPEGQISFRFISDGVLALYGVTVDEAMRDGQVLQRMRHPDDSRRVQAGLTAAEVAASQHNDEFRIIRRDGEQRWVQATSAPLRRGDDGDMRCGLIVDITAHKQAQDLRAERDQADAARRATAGLLSRISHELRTPLNAVLGFAQLLERDPALGPRQRQFAAESLRAGQHLLALVDDVLDLGRAESGEFSLQLTSLDPAETLETTHGLLAAQARQAGLSLTLPDGPLPAVRADPQRLRQVLTNLVSNAIKYNRPGGWVHVTVHAADGMVLFQIEDNGFGLDADQLSRLFRPFDRLGAERSNVTGTGLGLTLSLQLARAMGGTIDVRSAPGEGSCFTLRLPAG